VRFSELPWRKVEAVDLGDSLIESFDLTGSDKARLPESKVAGIIKN
jgi:hypothetical protein